MVEKHQTTINKIIYVNNCEGTVSILITYYFLILQECRQLTRKL